MDSSYSVHTHTHTHTHVLHVYGDRERETETLLCNPGYPRTHCVAQAGFKLTATLVLQSPSAESFKVAFNLENDDDDDDDDDDGGHRSQARPWTQIMSSESFFHLCVSAPYLSSLALILVVPGSLHLIDST